MSNTAETIVYPGNVNTNVEVHELNYAQRQQFEQQQQAANAQNAVKIFKLEVKAAITRKIKDAQAAYEAHFAETKAAGEALTKAVRAFALEEERRSKASKALVAAINEFFPDADMTINRLLPSEPRLISEAGRESFSLAEWAYEEDGRMYARFSVDSAVSIPDAARDGHPKDGWKRDLELNAKLAAQARRQLVDLETSDALKKAWDAAKAELTELETNADLLEAAALRQQLEASGESGKKLLDSVNAMGQAAVTGNWLKLESAASSTPAALPAPETRSKRATKSSKK